MNFLLAQTVILQLYLLVCAYRLHFILTVCQYYEQGPIAMQKTKLLTEELWKMLGLLLIATSI